MTIDISKNGYVRYRHYNKKYDGNVHIYEHRLNLLLKYNLLDVLNGVVHHVNGC